MNRRRRFPLVVVTLGLLGALGTSPIAAFPSGAVDQGARPVLPADPTLDDDGDGRRNLDDQCPATEAGDLIDSQGCGLSDACPCDGTADGDFWGSHDAYLACVKATGKAMRLAGEHSRKEVRKALRRAKRSTCGNDNLTRCCVWSTNDVGDTVGQCLQITVDRCDTLAADPATDGADDIGPGVCDPDACAAF